MKKARWVSRLAFVGGLVVLGFLAFGGFIWR